MNNLETYWKGYNIDILEKEPEDMLESSMDALGYAASHLAIEQKDVKKIQKYLMSETNRIKENNELY